MIILTGGAGFIGSVILEMLNRRGENDIMVVDRLATSNKWKNLLGKRFRDYVPRERFLAHLEERGLPKETTAVIHMGACSATTEMDADYLMEINVRFSKVLATAAIDRGVRFIYASSAATYGNGEHGYSDDERSLSLLHPLNRYGFSKHIFDQWLLDTGRISKAAGLKFFNVYGPNEYHKGSMSSVAYKSYLQLVRTGHIDLFRSYRKDFADGEQKRDFIYVRDCASVVSWLLDSPRVSGIFNVGSGKARSWNDLALAVCGAANVQPAIKYVDMPQELQGQYQYFTEAPMEKLKLAGFSKPFTTLEDGVREYIQKFLSGGERGL